MHSITPKRFMRESYIKHNSFGSYTIYTSFRIYPKVNSQVNPKLIYATYTRAWLRLDEAAIMKQTCIYLILTPIQPYIIIKILARN